MKALKYIRYLSAHISLPGLILISLCARSQGLQIGEGISLIIGGEGKVVLNDLDLINNGRISSWGGTFIFEGSKQLPVRISGSMPILFHNIKINRSSGWVQLENDIRVSGSIFMDNGNIELNRRVIELGNTGSIVGENINSYITGQKGGIIRVTTNLNAPHSINPGNLGLKITSTQNLGSTVITRGHEKQADLEGEAAIYRYFDIKPTFNPNANIDLEFHYIESELVKRGAKSLIVWSQMRPAESWTTNGGEFTKAGSDWVGTKSTAIPRRITLAPAPGKRSGNYSFLQAYPNPANEQFTLMITSTPGVESVLSLHDKWGRILERKRIKFSAGINTIHWNIEKYSAGTYFVVFENSGLPNAKIIKQ